MTTSDDIELLYTNFKTFQLKKNLEYGDAAINPINIFPTNGPCGQIGNRLNDKLSRIKKSTVDGKQPKKNDVCDTFGYLALMMIKNGWTEFEDLLE